MPSTDFEKPHFRLLGGVASEWYYSEKIITYVSKKNKKGIYTAYLPCDHKKLISPGGLYELNGVTVDRWNHPEVIPWDSYVAYGLSQAHIGLDFQENNNFELIPFLMDWDSTLAMFTKKFFRELSYGAVTWGVMPFISDIKALGSSLDDIQDGILKSYEKILGKRITRRFEWSHEIRLNPNYGTKANGRTIVFGICQGDTIYPDTPSKAIAVFLDEIGLNPDLKTAWDVIPLSFVVDYFLPIGDLLERIHPRGWFNPTFTLNGGYSIKYTLEDTIYPSAYPNVKGSASSKWTHYVRSPGILQLPAVPPIEPAYTSPNFRELFNTAYLGTGLKKLF